MPLEPGGLADKLGNRYEGRWVASQLLSLLDEKIHSVTIEAIGDDEQGVDLWIELNNGIRQAHQCKARNGSNEFWSIGDLAGKGILENLKYQLSRSSKYEFFLVSSVGSSVFSDICDYARRSNNDPNLFYQEKILKASLKVRNCFKKFCKYLSLEPDNETDLCSIYSYLCRTYIHIYPDDRETYQVLLTQADYLLLGESEVIVSTLLNYVENHNKLGSKIFADDLRNYLVSVCIHPKRLEHDERVAPAIQELQDQFDESIKPSLINRDLLKREETKSLLQTVETGHNAIISGNAGVGKSGVLFELVDSLKKRSIPYLPIRLDRREPQDTSARFGQQMGLPDCPAYTLSAYAGDRRSVLVLDQLDALRWTSAHSNNALDVCQQLVRHVEQLQRSGRKITVILSCRTFDLTHDPSIRSWLGGEKGKQFSNIEVKELSAEVVEAVVGTDYSKMTGKIKKLLAVPLNLSIWSDLNSSGEVPVFNTATDLISKFWEMKRSVLVRDAGISHSVLNNILDSLIHYMEVNGKISAPERVVAEWHEAIEALCSYGVLQKTGKQISFCHQRYLDYLIASRLLGQIDDGPESISDWLGCKERQSLFRREQLRQALTMLAEESPVKFFEAVKVLLDSDGARFHIKHLALELIGSQDFVSDRLGAFCLSLYEDEYWGEHVYHSVFWGNPHYFQYLVKKGLISEWLDSSESESIEKCLNLLRSVAEKVPDDVTEILEPYLSAGGNWPEWVHGALSWSVEDDSDRMFLLRLQLMRLGYVRDFVDWPSLCSKYPLRSIQLIETYLSTWKNKSSKHEEKKRNRIDSLYDRDIEAFSKVAETVPEEIWRVLVPQVQRLTDFEDKSFDPLQDQWREPRRSELREVGISRGVIELILLAGEQLAKSNVDLLIEYSCLLEKSTSPVIREILVSVYSHLPEEYADLGIEWFLSKNSKLGINSSYYLPKWKAAARLIAQLSPHCSAGLFDDLEKRIIDYHSPNERSDAEYALKGWRRGCFDYYWGEAQYFLLPALAGDRIKQSTADLIRVLRRKFAGYSDEKFVGVGLIRGGWVGSKLASSYRIISDKSWLKIIKNENIGKKTRANRIQQSEDSILESSVAQFSTSLQNAAGFQPNRFARLALKFPSEVHPDYITAILKSSSLSEPDKSWSDKDKAGWEPAKIELVEQILEKFQTGDDRESAISFCRMISARANESWSSKVLGKLVYFAQSHPDLEPETLNIHCDKTSSEASVATLFQNTINCVRGVAAEAIGRLLWENRELLESLRPAIEALVNDPHPAVRMASIDIVLPVLNIDRDQAVDWFVKASKDDLRVAASPRATVFFNYAIPSHIDQLRQIVCSMATSSLEDVSTSGARQVTARWIFHGYFEDEIRICQVGSVSQRKGVANVASSLLREKSYRAACEPIILSLLDDPDKEVRSEFRGLFRDKDCYSNAENGVLISSYLKSKAFADDPDLFVWGVKDVTGSVLSMSETIFKMFDAFCSTLKETSRDVSSGLPYAISEAVSILLRLYEQALAVEDAEKACRCLDIWDALFENRIGVAHNLTMAIDDY